VIERQRPPRVARSPRSAARGGASVTVGNESETEEPRRDESRSSQVQPGGRQRRVARRWRAGLWDGQSLSDSVGIHHDFDERMGALVHGRLVGRARAGCYGPMAIGT